MRQDIAPSEQAERNAATILRQHEVFSSGDAVGAAAFFAEDTRNHGVPVGRAGVLRVLTDILTTFPDWRFENEHLAAVGDEVVVLVVASGTHQGVGRIPVNGGLLVGVPATGKRFRVQHIHWYTVKNGLITDHRANRDDIGMMQQLGLAPAVERYDLPKI